MKIHLLSDVHNEFTLYDAVKTDADVIVLAGDIFPGTYAIKWIHQNFPNKPVIYVAGNHEYYGESYPSLNQEIKNHCQGQNIYFLEKDVIKIDDVIFLGTTLWTDFNLFGDAQAAMEEAQHRMGDYYEIEHADHDRYLLPSDTQAAFYQSISWLEQMLTKYQDKEVVVVTHHAPSGKSLPVVFENDPLSPAYASNLESFISQHNIKLWLHGHIHSAVDYHIGNTQVIANPKGYPHEPNSGFINNLIIEI